MNLTIDTDIVCLISGETYQLTSAKLVGAWIQATTKNGRVLVFHKDCAWMKCINY